MKRAKYENVLGLLAYWNMRLASLTTQNMSISKFGKMRPSVTWMKYRTFKLVGFLVGCRKKKSLYDFGGKLRGKIRTASIVRGIVRDYWRTNVLDVPRSKICIDDRLANSIYFTSS